VSERIPEAAITVEVEAERWHARTISYFIRAVADLRGTHVEVVVVDGPSEGYGCWFECAPSGYNLLRLTSIGARRGDVLRVSARGPHAPLAIARLRRVLAVEAPPRKHGEMVGPPEEHALYQARMLLSVPLGSVFLKREEERAKNLVRRAVVEAGLDPGEDLDDPDVRRRFAVQVLEELEERRR
jgi:hypothetical protein